MRILGLDLASEPRNTWVVIVNVGPTGHAVALLYGETATDDVLVALAREVDVTGVDAPLGWPLEFITAVAAITTAKGWSAGRERSGLRYRRTDLVVQATTGIWPLSVSSDKLGVTAMRCHICRAGSRCAADASA